MSLLKGKKMPPVKAVYVPRFGSQSSSSVRDETSLDQSEISTPSQSVSSGKKRVKRAKKPARPLLKVKLPRPSQRNDKVDNKLRRKLMLETTGSKRNSSVNKEKPAQSTSTSLAHVDGDVFFFSQTSNTKTSEKEKAKLLVLRTLSKMLEENRLIRLRLASLSQAR